MPLLGAIAGCAMVGGGEGRPTLAEWTWIAGYHYSVLWLGGRVTTNFGGVDVVPLQGAIVVRYGWGG